MASITSILKLGRLLTINAASSDQMVLRCGNSPPQPVHPQSVQPVPAACTWRDSSRKSRARNRTAKRCE